MKTARKLILACTLSACMPVLARNEKPIGDCRATFEQHGKVHGLPRWYLVMDRAPSDPSLARGSFAAEVTYTIRTVGKDGRMNDQPDWVQLVGLQDQAQTRAELYFWRWKYNVINVRLFTCKAVSREQQ